MAFEIPKEVMEVMQRLKAMSEGATAEAPAAAIRLQAFLQKYQLGLADIAERKVGEEVEPDERKYTGGKRMPDYYIHYFSAVAQGFNCKVIWYTDKTRLIFVGLKSDVLVAGFFAETTFPIVKAEGRSKAKRLGYKGHEVTAFVKDFSLGAAGVIRDRLLWKASALQSQDDRYKALVPLKAEKVTEFLADKWPGLKFEAPPDVVDEAALEMGQRFGHKMDIVDGLPEGEARAKHQLE